MDDFDFGYPRGACNAVYQVSGKCEKHMQHNYEKYDNACEYIQGITIAVSNDGIVMTVRRSGKADIVMGLLAISTVLLAMYVYYLQKYLGVQIEIILLSSSPNPTRSWHKRTPILSYSLKNSFEDISDK